MVKKLTRNMDDKILGGVCSGIADYLGVNPLIIRILWIVFTLFFAIGLIVYIICWILLPTEEDTYVDVKAEYKD